MSWVSRLRNLLDSTRHGRELDRELDFHIAERADSLETGGMERGEAERQARIHFGHREGVREETREMGIVGWLETSANDLRYALRGLRSNPGFTFTVVFSLALGIGANTAIFSLINAVLLKSLPVAEPGRLMQLTMGTNRGDVFTNPIWEAVRGEAQRVDGNYVGGDFFQTLGLAPAAGRLLSDADDYRGCPPLVVLGNGFWRSRYAGAPGAIGQTLALDGHPFQIVGVAPSGFSGVEVGRAAQLYVPLCAEAVIQGANSLLDQRTTWWLQLIGRPAPGLAAAQVNAHLSALAHEVFSSTAPADLDAKDVRYYLSSSLEAIPAETGLSDLRTTYRPALMMLMAVVGIVLLIACGNVANLLLARGTVRQREIAMRLALGASRGRLIRQMLTESLLLSLLGAAAGLLLARWGSALLVRLLSSGRDGVWLDLALDYHLLAFTLGVAVATGVLFGLVPAWRGTRVDPQAAIRAQGHGVIRGGSARFTLGKALVLGQVALSLVLALGAALLLTTFHTLATLDPGFRREGILAVRMDLRSSGESDVARLAIGPRAGAPAPGCDVRGDGGHPAHQWHALERSHQYSGPGAAGQRHGTTELVQPGERRLLRDHGNSVDRGA